MRSLLINLINGIRINARRPVTTTVQLARPIFLQNYYGKSLGFFSTLHLNTHKSVINVSQRDKSTKSGKGRQGKHTEEEEDVDDEEGETFDSEDQSKITAIRVPSLRMDAVLKGAFGISRQKIEAAFYQNRIYLNGRLVPKKHHSVTIKDELDYVKGTNALNDKFIDVMRVEIVDIQVPNGDHIVVKLNRYRSLTSENYSDHPWSDTNE